MRLALSSAISFSIALSAVVDAGVALAQPAAAQCQVNVVRAPEDVRRMIEAWVRREAACRTSIEVRVIPTDNGLYVLAREPSGRIYERLVPDAQAAGVLITSWIASDSLAPVPTASPPHPVVSVAAVVPVGRPPVVVAAPEVSAQEPTSAPVRTPCRVTVAAAPATVELASRAPASPGATPVVASNVGGKRQDHELAADPRQWGIGIAAYGARGWTARGDMDLARFRGFVAGVIVSGRYGLREGSDGRRFDGKVMVGLSTTPRFGLFYLRLQAAAGMAWDHTFYAPPYVEARNTFAVPLEAAASAGVRINGMWSVNLGPVYTGYWDRTEQGQIVKDDDLETELAFLAELRRQL